MSRIILSKWPNGQDRVVVGWDHPAGGVYYQEFNKEPEPDANGHVEWPDDWEEMLRFDGYMPGIPLDEFHDRLPDDLKPLVTDEVMDLIRAHAKDPDSGYRRTPIDLT